MGLIKRIRDCREIVVVMVFFSLLTDSMLLTLVDPILPDILRQIDNNTVVVSGKRLPDLPPANDVTHTDDFKIDTETEISDTLNANGRYGFLVAAKGVTQFICNPFVGTLVTKFGYRKPMLVGTVVLFLSTFAFAFGNSYQFLFGTRMLQGCASAVTAVTGMGLLAATYDDDQQRGKIMGIAIGGLSMGIIVGPIYGSVLYELFGQAVPFITLAGVVLLTFCLQLLAYKPGKLGSDKDHSLTEIFKLLLDPYILIVAGNVFLLNLDVSVVLAFLPIRLIDLEDPPTWKLGIVVLPTSIGYMIAGIIFPRTTRWLKRWLCAILGLILSSSTMFFLAYSNTFVGMLIITTFLGLALGMVSTSMQPIFAHLVDIRHSAVYGNVYAISDMSVCLAMSLGPLIGGPIEYKFGFEWLVIGIAIMNLCFAQFCILLRNPPGKSSKKHIEKAKSFGFDNSDSPMGTTVCSGLTNSSPSNEEKQPLLYPKLSKLPSEKV